jgi:hypothetical protein
MRPVRYNQRRKGDIMKIVLCLVCLLFCCSVSLGTQKIKIERDWDYDALKAEQWAAYHQKHDEKRVAEYKQKALDAKIKAYQVRTKKTFR